MEYRGDAKFFPLDLLVVLSPGASAYSDMYSIYLLDASHNPLHVDNKTAVIFVHNSSRIN